MVFLVDWYEIKKAKVADVLTKATTTISGGMNHGAAKIFYFFILRSVTKRW
jgi:hypothetical protein